MRTAEISRDTRETKIYLKIDLDGRGRVSVDTGVGFFNHMLELFGVHSGVDLTVRCEGDTDVDFHHSVEDVGICLGKAFKEALGDKKGIARFADRVVPMDECAALVALDISGRPFLNFEKKMKRMGTTRDWRPAEFKTVQKMTLPELAEFYRKNLAPLNYDILIVGKTSLIDRKKLARYGEIVELKLEDIFGY